MRMGKQVLIIAEAGLNHNGSLDLAKQLALEAKKAGADIVKYQTAKLDSLVSKHAEMAEYQKKNIGRTMSQKEMLKGLLLSFDDFEELSTYCKSIEIGFLSTPFDIESIELLDDLGIPFWKIPSGEITNYPYLLKIASTKKPVILSTGMCSIEEVKQSFDLLKANGTKDITLLHCTTQYPTKHEDVNLSAMNTLQSVFGCQVGYSDHTNGIEISLAAVAMGARVIEKHFTLDKGMEGPDHKASLEPDELLQMVKMIRNIELSIGDGVKTPCVSELPNRLIARKSIVAKKRIHKGEIYTDDNLTTKRPGTGINPMRWEEVIGKEANRDYDEDELIDIED